MKMPRHLSFPFFFFFMLCLALFLPHIHATNAVRLSSTIEAALFLEEEDEEELDDNL